MEIIKKTISLEGITSRRPDSTWGTITASTISINIPLYQSINNLGIYIDEDFINGPLIEPFSINGAPNLNNILSNKIYSEGDLYPFMTGATNVSNVSGFTKDLRLAGRTFEFYTANTGFITGFTDDKLNRVKSYDLNNQYQIGFDVEQDPYVNIHNEYVDGVSRIFSLANPTGYTVDAKIDSNIGTPTQITGIQYSGFSNFRSYIDSESNTPYTIPVTLMRYKGEGWNESNIQLKALTRVEYLLNKVFPPTVNSDVFIDRGSNNVLEPHLRLSEVKSLNHLVEYGNGFYKVVKQ